MSSPDEIAISIKGVSKNFKLPHQNADSIKSLFINPLVLFGKKQQVEVQHALKDISFDIKKGEFFGIVGRNGSGKSTLLKILAEIYQPSSGEVSVEGRLVPFIELGVGFNPELTGRENVYLSGALNGFSEKEIDEMYGDIVEFAELEAFMDQKLKNYSSGMQVRLAFSVATRSKADVLLIDEVLAVGDADFQRKCFNYFMELKRAKVTVVFVTHDMTAVRQFCDRAVLIKEGRVGEIGDVDMVASSYSDLFMSAEQTSQVEHKDGNLNSKNFRNPEILVGDDITIRCEITPINKLEDPVVGFTLRDAAGLAILGSNSRLLNKPVGVLAKGKHHGVSWNFGNILSDGDYVVDLALVQKDGVTVIDWWNDALRFSVKKPILSPYPVSPVIDLTIVKSA